MNRSDDVPATSGIYFVRLLGEELISVNDHDAKRREHCIMVNLLNCKFGQAKDLRRRMRDYERTFRGRAVFEVLCETTRSSELESDLKRHFALFRMRGKSGRQHEWLQGIAPKEALERAKIICIRFSTAGFPLLPRDSDLSDNNLGTPFPIVPRPSVTPENVVEMVDYLDTVGMPESILSEIHHFRKQRYADTRGYFSKTQTMRKDTNLNYACRLQIMVSGHKMGQSWNSLKAKALEAYPL